MNKIVKKLRGENAETKKLEELYKKPKKEKLPDEGASFQVFEPNLIQQADLLFLPHDKGFKYALVVVDDASKICDAEPIKNKNSIDVLNAFKKIYHRNILKLPQIQIEVDDGSEFKGEVAEYFKKHKIRVRVAEPNRHRQQGLVELKNKILGSTLLQLQTLDEMKTKKS
jgi:hypothetical protein